MGLLRNKHVIIAMLVSPVLAVISYFAVDHMVAETPHAAQAGNSYQLIEKSNWRYHSGACDLQTGEFSLRLTGKNLADGKVEITLLSDFELTGVLQALVDQDGNESSPFNMIANDTQGKEWRAEVWVNDSESERMYLAISAKDALYYADASLTFIEREFLIDSLEN